MSWLNQERLTVYPAIFLGVYLILYGFLTLGGSGLLDREGFPLGRDFSHYWVASSLALAGEPADHALCLLAGAQLTYRLDGSAKMLLFRCGIPDAVLPTVSAQLIVSADSKQILRTPLRTSLDDPQAFSLSIAGAKTLTLRVQSSAPLPCPLLCDQVQLVK